MKRRESSLETGYELKDASVPIVLISVGILFAGILGSLAVGGWLYVHHYRGAPSGGFRQTSFTQGPAQRTGISVDYQKMKDQAQQNLQTYGWSDQKAGKVRIPIDRAMDLIATEQPKSKAPAAQ